MTTKRKEVQAAEHEGDRAFEAVVALLDYPMFVVTTRHGDHRAGCLVGFASQVSIHPPRFLAGLSKKNHTFEVASAAEHLAVHVLSREHLDLARLFGSQTGDDIDKFARCAWRDGPNGLPILDDATAWFSGRILERLPLGDHVAFLTAPEAGSAPIHLGQLVTFADVRDLEPGHEA
ncbi:MULTISPECIES: flavin reductase family protein [Rhodococcus]|jgi:flavin reductase (DIM6/NTAB) family NADH-FMN oxidoreductase RutF|uniref:Oxidoreductase n=1 Tax=Rhodococcus oxybenzonivorans TaxID=1990687 RepID=A0A2S2C6M2_9NOCA|nr:MULTISPECIES: flavin reductase family protein [Rhodococcus]AWK76463.1 oxidoreductase [Rhodococcus oxybenzonivorans]